MINRKVNIFQPADTFDCKVNGNSNVEAYFNKLSTCTGEPYQSTSSLTSSLSEKAGSSYNGLLARSKGCERTNTPFSSKSKRDSPKSDLGLIGATTSPYRSEWESKNRPFCMRYYPPHADNRETEKDKFISIISSGKSQNVFSSPNSDKHSPSIIQLNSISSRRIDKLVNVREDEKDKLAQIFAFSSPLKKQYANSNVKKNNFSFNSFKTGNQPHISTSPNLLPSNGCKDKTVNALTIDLPEEVVENVNGDSTLVKSPVYSPSLKNERCPGNCKNCSCSTPKLERTSDKEVQAYFDDFITPLQETVSNEQYSKIKQNVSPSLVGQCYSNKEVQSNCDTVCDSFSDKFKQNKIVSPKRHFENSKVVDSKNINDKQNLSPRRFVPASDNFEDKTVKFFPLQVTSSQHLNTKRMVRVGEFSPLNPKLNSPGQGLLGLGEYEERRRKLLMEQRKHEYCQYLEQARLAAKSNQELKKFVQPTQEESQITNMRDATTQTDSSSPKKDVCIKQDNTSLPAQSCNPDSEDSSKISGLTSVQMKQFLYREELRKQIEERQRLEAEKREKEKLEEEAMETKIKQQQKKMQQKYEAEMAERMELALKKNQQEEALHHRLAEMQKQTLNEKQQQWKHRKDLAGLSPRTDHQPENVSDILIHQKETAVVPHTTREIVHLNPYQKEREKIFKEINDIEKQYSELRQTTVHHQSPVIGKRLSTTLNAAEKGSSNESFKSPLSQKLSKRDNKDRAFTVIDIDDNSLSRVSNQHDAAEEILRRPLIELIPPHPPSLKSTPVKTSATALRNSADDILRQPLLPLADAEKFRNVRDVIPLLPRSNSPPIPAATSRARRTNSETLDDKWQIPAVEKYVVTPLDIHSHNNRSVLTQLGAFRKHLQEEQMRMAQELKSTKVKPS